MTETDWTISADAGAMLDLIWQQEGPQLSTRELRAQGGWSAAYETDLDRSLHGFYLASCRRIWPLLPQDASRRGVETGERFLAGMVSQSELLEADYEVEGAAFRIEYNRESAEVAQMVFDLGELPPEVLRSLLHPPEAALAIEPWELLLRAAYFANYAMLYPSLRPKGPPREGYRIFLSADDLREHVAFPGRASGI